MNNLFQLATAEIARFLATNLPALSDNWWKKHVEDRLTFPQQRFLQERGLTSLDQLDFAALLRLVDQNWYELSQLCNLPREGRSWVKELQTVRNKWAHQSAQAIAPSEVYRDADTLGRFLEILGATTISVAAIEATKNEAVTMMAGARAPALSAPASPECVVDPATLTASRSKEPESMNTRHTMFQVGDLAALRSNPDTLVPIMEVIPGGAECQYVVFQDNKPVKRYESQLQHPTADTALPQQMNAEGLRAYLTSVELLSPSTAHLFSLRSGRVQFVPYQYRPVLKLIRADRPRLLIADEVGVGKTIEAGLIIKELRARGDIASVLIICPKALVAERKWFVEMKRFDEVFTALDGRTLRHCLQETHLDGVWPNQYAKAIVPFSLFDSDLISGGRSRGNKPPGLETLDPPPHFDLVIVDEAHHIRNPNTYLHQAVRYFCEHAEAAIFLTATPVQLGSRDLFTLLNVLRPDLVIDHASFEQMAAPNRPINMAVQHCRLAEDGWQREARACLDEAANTQWGQMFLRESPAFQSDYDQLGDGEPVDDVIRVRLIRSLEELYTFSGVINRTRRRDIGDFTTRKPETIEIPFTSEQQALHDDLLDLLARILAFHGRQNVRFMMTNIRRRAASCLYGLAPLLDEMLAGKLDKLEMMETVDDDTEPDLGFVAQVRDEIQSLLNRAHNLDPHDPKADAFIKVLRDKAQLPNNKALVFSTFRHTLAFLAKHVQTANLRFGLVHGDIPDDERADLRRRFSLPKDSAEAIDVLLSSEVGCEGLDFQFCDLLVNYDLPWNPMRIEQRIGRIDRYGQKSETVAIVNMITPGTVDADIYERCLERIGVFQHAVGGSEEILGEITEKLHEIADSFELTEDERKDRLQQLADNGIRQIQEQQALEKKEAELFGLSVPKQSWEQEIQAAETSWLSPVALQRCVSAYLATVLGAEGEYLLGDKPLKTLRLSKDARKSLLDDRKPSKQGSDRQHRASDPLARNWEKWLTGVAPTLAVTFDQQTAAENHGVVHLNVLHPLVRQAATFLSKSSDPIHVSLRASGSGLPTGRYPFALYKWEMKGVKANDTIVAVTTDGDIEDVLLGLLLEATDSQDDATVDDNAMQLLEDRHHSKWSEGRANHIAQNRELVEYRAQSLKVSHQARCGLIQDQIERATNDNIRRMKESELARVQQEHDRQREQLSRDASAADIHATPLVFGNLSVR